MLYTIIYDFMWRDLRLRGAEKEVFAVIYGFWKKGKAAVEVPVKTVMDITGLSRTEEGTWLVEAGGETLESRCVVNAAGVYAGTIHNMVSDMTLEIIPRKGEYLLLDTAAAGHVRHTIFMLPTKMGKGILVSPTVHGNVLVGPTATDVDDPEEVARIIGTPAHLEFRDPNNNVVVEGKDIKQAGVQYANDEKTLYGVGFELDAAGAKAFENATREFLGQSISIYLDDDMISAPTVQAVIAGGNGIITSSSSASSEESYNWARNLAMLIQSGALPMDIAEVETRAISATLGIEAIDGAIIAGIVGLVLVLVFMLVMYRLPGVAADMALLIYVLIVFYALAITGVQLTLQGIAGILLGIGMAVDANVVIFERFREELKEGRTPLNAVKFGFRNAGRAVLDSNVTTLIAAVVLMIFGTGTIKGFATTLMISIIASYFTAVVVTRGLLILICKLGINNRSAYTR